VFKGLINRGTEGTHEISL